MNAHQISNDVNKSKRFRVEIMSKSNKCHLESSSSSEKSFGNYQRHQQQQRKSDNPLSHICKYLDVNDSRKSSKDNVELALEVEINESLKHVLTNPDGHSSDLLDVTIIRPSDSDTTHETTVALNKDEVRDFISLVEQHNRYHNETKDGSVVEGNYKEKLQKHRYAKMNKNDHKNRGPEVKQQESQDNNSEKNDKIGESPKHVYATLNTFDKLRQSLPCQNKNRDSEKPGTPCMCQHCGVVGVLVQSQKGPVAPFPPLENTQGSVSPRSRESSAARRDPARQRKVSDIKKKRSLDQLQLLREINSRIKSLERRIAVQEQTAVPREYLKHILHRVLTQYNNVKFPLTGPKLRHNATQYSAKNIADQSCQRNIHSANSDRRKKDDCRKSYQVHTVLEDCPKWIDNSKAKKVENDKSANDKDVKFDLDYPYWLWGKEVVKPGCDLRDKILQLLDDKFWDGQHRKELPKSEKPSPTVEKPKEQSAGNTTNGGIRVEKDEKTIFLNNVPNETTVPENRFNHLHQGTGQLAPTPDSVKDDASVCSKPVCEPQLPTHVNKFSNYRNITPKSHYPFDLKKTLDDSTFKKNIEAQKEKNKEKPATPQIEEKYFNAYATHSITTESQASMNYLLQKIKNNAKVLESGLPRDKEQQLETKFKIPTDLETPRSVIKENLTKGGFRYRKEVIPSREMVDIKYVSPKIKQWSEESSTSQEKIMRMRNKSIADKQENVALEKKESLICKNVNASNRK